MTAQPPSPTSSFRASETSNAADRLLTASEVAAMLAVPERWVLEHTRSGLIPHVQLGRYVRYRRDRVLAWIGEQERGGAVWRKHRPRSVDRR